MLNNIRINFIYFINFFFVVSCFNIAYSNIGQDSLKYGKTYRNLICAGAEYQKDALTQLITKLYKNKSDNNNQLYLCIALDHLILELYGNKKENHFSKAMMWLKKIKNEKLQNNNLVQQLINMGKTIDEDQYLSILASNLNEGNAIIKKYFSYKKNRDLSFLVSKDFNELIVSDYLPMDILIWKEPVKLYNPFNLVCLSKLWFENANNFFLELNDMKGYNLYFFLESCFYTKKYDLGLKVCNNINNDNLCKENPYAALTLAKIFYKTDKIKRANEIISKVQKNPNKAVHFNIALYIAELQQNHKSAKEYLFKYAPENISENMKDYHNIFDSSYQDRLAQYYYQILAKIYQLNGNQKAAFRCYRYVYVHSFGLDMSKYNPEYLANIISTSLNQDGSRNLLDEYLLRPPGKTGPKTFIDICPGSYSLMYYFGLINIAQNL